MSERSLELEILAELKKVIGNKKLKLKHIREWSTMENVIREHLKIDESRKFLPKNGVWVAYETAAA